MTATTFFILLITVAGCIHTGTARPLHDRTTEVQKSVQYSNMEGFRTGLPLFICLIKKTMGTDFFANEPNFEHVIGLFQVMKECFETVKHNPKQFMCTSMQ